MSRFKGAIAVLVLAVMALTAPLTMGLTWVQNSGLLSADAVVFPSDASAIDKMMARALEGAYGDRIAVCDGSGDDVEINAALSAVEGEVALGEGSFSISSPLIPDTGDGIHGRSRYTTILELANGANCDVIQMASDNVHRYGVSIRDLKILGNKDNNTTGNGIVMHAAWWSDITHVTVRECPEKGIYYSGATGEGGQRATIRSVDVHLCNGTGIDIGFRANTDSIMDQIGTYSNGMTSGYNVYIGSSDWQVYSLNASVTPAGKVNVRVDGSEFGVTFFGLIVTDTDAGAIGLQFYSSSAWNYHSGVIGGYIMNESSDPNTGYGIELKYGGTKHVENSVFDGVKIKKYAYGVKATGALVSDTIITNCVFESQATACVLDTATRTRAYGNTGYIAPGEIRTYASAISSLTQNSYNSLDNPFGQDVLLVSVDHYVSAGASATSPNLDCGLGSSATSDYTNLANDIPGETIGDYNSVNTATYGQQTSPVLWQSGSGNRYLNTSIKDAAATGMVCQRIITVMGV